MNSFIRIFSLILPITFILASCDKKTNNRQFRPPTDVSDCESACNHIGPKEVKYSDGTIKRFPDALNCEEGRPLEMVKGGCSQGIDDDKCVSCKEFCRHMISANVWLIPSCVKNMKSCDEIDKCRPDFE